MQWVQKLQTLRKHRFSTRTKLILALSIGLTVFGLTALHPFIPFTGHGSDGTTYEQARVVRAYKDAGNSNKVDIVMLHGADEGKTVSASIGAVISSLDLTPPEYKKGDVVMVSRSTFTGGVPVYTAIDHYRLPLAAWLFLSILVVAIAFAGIRGVGSLVGLVLSVAVIGFFIIPNIIHGSNPYLTTGIGIMVISSIGIFLAHGFSRRTGLALIGTYITLGFAVVVSSLAIRWMHLSGIATENVFYLSHLTPNLSMSGLLLCGTLISLIGIVDDITVGQATSVEELHHANTALSSRELYRRGLKIGREHIASLVNTLVLVYVGTSFLFIVFLSATSPYPLLINLNSELVMEEVVRSLVGSASLILAVPITTLLAARFLRRTPVLDSVAETNETVAPVVAKHVVKPRKRKVTKK